MAMSLEESWSQRLFPVEGLAQWEHAGRQGVPDRARKNASAEACHRPAAATVPVKTVQAWANPGIVPLTGLTVRPAKSPKGDRRIAARARTGCRRIFAPITKVASLAGNRWLECLRN
jgi:hypothetical protein